MRASDIPEVLRIDAASFVPPWPERSYRFELHESNVSYMLVLTQRVQRPVRGWRRWWNDLVGSDNESTEPEQKVVGYGGLWKIAEESHISTIATHPDYRGQRYGEIMLVGMIGRAIALEAGYIVLEVRVSNTIAQNLYHKHDFEIQGVKRNYYHHDNEDAYAMRLDLTREIIARYRARYKRLQQIVPFHDDYSCTPHPRLGR